MKNRPALCHILQRLSWPGDSILRRLSGLSYFVFKCCRVFFLPNLSSRSFFSFRVCSCLVQHSSQSWRRASLSIPVPLIFPLVALPSAGQLLFYCHKIKRDSLCAAGGPPREGESFSLQHHAGPKKPRAGQPQLSGFPVKAAPVP